MPFDSITNNIIAEIKKVYSLKTLIPFLGSGFSANIKGYPVWSEFIINLQIDLLSRPEIVKKAGLKTNGFNLAKMFNQNWMEATEFYYWCYSILKNGDSIENFSSGKKDFRNLLMKQFDDSKLRPQSKNDTRYEQHFIITNKFNKIYTTNWDSTITDAREKNELDIKEIYCGINSDKLESKSSEVKKIKVFHYHGCYCDDLSESIVASETDYFTRIKNLNKNPLDILLMKDLLQNNFLFLGYSLSDVNVSYFINQINQIKINKITGDKRPCYIALMKTRKEIIKSKQNFYSKWKDIIKVPLLTDEDNTEIKNKEKKIDEKLLKNIDTIKRPIMVFNKLKKEGLISENKVTSLFDWTTRETFLTSFKNYNGKEDIYSALLENRDFNKNIKRELYQKKTIEFLKTITN